MTPDIMTLGQLIHAILDEHQISVEQFCQRYKLKVPTLYNWIQDRGGVNKLPYQLIEALAGVANVTPAEIYRRIGIDVLAIPQSRTKFDLTDSRFAIFVQNAKHMPKLQAAIDAAVLARRTYCYEGNLNEVLTHYERSLTFAREAKATCLIPLIKSHLCNICEMTGKLDEAEHWFQQAYEEALGLQHEAKKSQNQALELLATQIALKVKLHWFWANHWARGARQSSITEGEALLREVRRSHYYQKIPDVYDFLARCSVALGDFEQAIDYMTEAELHVYLLTRPEFAQYEMFLDAGSLLSNGKLDYWWQEYQQRMALIDILVAAGYISKAIKIYNSIQYHLPPSANFGVHNWHNPLWQDYLHQRADYAMADEKSSQPFKEYTRDLKESGDWRVLALNTYAQGENCLAKGDLALAMFCFESAFTTAKEIQAEDIRVKSILAASHVAVLQRNKPLAISYVTMVEETMPRIDNPLLKRMYRGIQEEIVRF